MNRFFKKYFLNPIIILAKFYFSKQNQKIIGSQHIYEIQGVIIFCENFREDSPSMKNINSLVRKLGTTR